MDGWRSDGREERNLRLLRARDRMDRHYAQPLDVVALAAVACMARSHFISEFRATFGETPHRYLQRRRIERAMHLLRWTDRPVTDICLAVGYSSLGTFSRTFADIVGESPSAYRDGAVPQPAYVPGAFSMSWTRPSGPSPARPPSAPGAPGAGPEGPAAPGPAAPGPAAPGTAAPGTAAPGTAAPGTG